MRPRPQRTRPHDSALPAGLRPRDAENTLRVDAARIDTVMNLVGELIIGKSMLQRTIAEFEHRTRRIRCAENSPMRSRSSRASSENLQKSVMKIRMVPVEQLFRRFPRVVRDVAKQRNKDIALEIAGQNTDLDKSILDALAEPLAHLVRNAADHGIETAAERAAAGKPPRGTIRLDAYHEGDQVVIEVSDDGRGLDREKIIRRAIERGIVSTRRHARLNDTEALQLIFAPGFSTADEVTEISGRGVGLDVVKSALDEPERLGRNRKRARQRHHVPADRAADARQHSGAPVPRRRTALRRADRCPSSKSRASPTTKFIASTITKSFNCANRC